VHEQPRPPTEDATQTDVEGQLGHRRVAADGRHLAVVEVAELPRPPAAHKAADLTAHEVALLERDRGHLQVRLTLVVDGASQVADHEDVVVAGRSQVAAHDDAASLPLLKAGRFGQRCRLDAGCPDERVRGQDLTTLEVHAAGTGPVDRLAQTHVDAALTQRVERRPLRLLGEAVEKIVGRLDEHDASAAHVEVVEVAVEHLEELYEGPRQLDSGRPTADDREGEGGLVEVVRLRCGALELGEHVAAQRCGVLDGLHRQGVFLDARDAEPAGLRAGGDDQVVVGQRRPRVHVHETSVEVDFLDGCPPEVDILVVLEDAPHGQGDVGGTQTGSRHLIQQRLEHVVVPLVDDGDVDRQVGQAGAGADAAETGPDHDDLRRIHAVIVRRSLPSGRT